MAPTVLIPDAVHGVLPGFGHAMYEEMLVSSMDCYNYFQKGCT